MGGILLGTTVDYLRLRRLNRRAEGVHDRARCARWRALLRSYLCSGIVGNYFFREALDIPIISGTMRELGT